jgi:8-oxo-dGTP diphosphatase
MAGKTIHAAGGIVVRGRAQRLVAVVQRSKDELWVLPRGKLKRDENPLAGARREAVEETGHRVRVREFVGAISYRARNRPKVVQFWRMQAEVNPSRDLTKDIAAVEWLTLAAAVRRCGGAAAELSAGEVVLAQCRPPRAQAPQAYRAA